MNAKEILSGIKKIDVKLANKLAERQKWESRKYRITSVMDVPKVSQSGGRSKLEDAVGLCEDAEAEIYDAVLQLRQDEKTAIGLLERLDSPIQYDVLHKRYIQMIPLQEIADMNGKSIDWAKKTERRGLRNIQQMLEK